MFRFLTQFRSGIGDRNKVVAGVCLAENFVCALEKILLTARELNASKVLLLFGCGGERDKTKRPAMGAVAERLSHFCIITSDNPRSEDPLAIIQDALPGLQKSGVRYAVEPDRKQAIALALAEAKPGDIVLVAGKGHEKTQTSREGVFPFDDVQVAQKTLQQMGYAEPVGGKK